MLLAAILFLFPIPQSGDPAKITMGRSAGVSVSSTNDSSLSQPLPAAPESKVKTDAEAPGGPDSAADASFTSLSAVGTPIVAIEPRHAPMPIAAVKSVLSRPRESAAQRRLWYALSFTGSGAAAFDAWSTRRAITQGYGVEGNPLLRPFSHSGALYAATQVSPVLMDYIGKRMMVSQHKLLRRMWWLPQAAGTGISLTAGVHNVTLVP